MIFRYLLLLLFVLNIDDNPYVLFVELEVFSISILGILFSKTKVFHVIR